MTASQQTESWCHGGCSRRSAAPAPLDVSAAAAEATKAGLCKPSQAPAPALGTRYHGLGTVPCNAAVIRHNQPSLQNSYPQKSIDYGNQFQPGACQMYLPIIIINNFPLQLDIFCFLSETPSPSQTMNEIAFDLCRIGMTLNRDKRWC